MRTFNQKSVTTLMWMSLLAAACQGDGANGEVNPDRLCPADETLAGRVASASLYDDPKLEERCASALYLPSVMELNPDLACGDRALDRGLVFSTSRSVEPTEHDQYRFVASRIPLQAQGREIPMDAWAVTDNRVDGGLVPEEYMLHLANGFITSIEPGIRHRVWKWRGHTNPPSDSANDILASGAGLQLTGTLEISLEPPTEAHPQWGVATLWFDDLSVGNLLRQNLSFKVPYWADYLDVMKGTQPESCLNMGGCEGAFARMAPVSGLTQHDLESCWGEWPVDLYGECDCVAPEEMSCTCL